MKKILLLIPVIILLILISEYLNGGFSNNKNVEKEFFMKEIKYDKLTIKLKKDLKSGEIIGEKNIYKLKPEDIKIEGEDIEIFYDLKKKIYHLNKEELIESN